MKECFKENYKVFETGLSDIAELFPKRSGNCNKGDFGYVALIGGSLEYKGLRMGKRGFHDFAA